ncbi:MAG: tryptophan 2,3-dioxygenase [Myxococcales bacterium]|nr:tryptophan 2,3-dioxygenase [Myxococcales bacterium]
MPAPTYWDYLHLPDLLSCQGGLDDAPAADELHFIIVHQVYELWFKLMLSQLRLARDHLAGPHLPEERVPFVVHHLGRVNAILRLCVDQFAVMETLPPQDFLDFRDKLVPSSGFQSFQMREFEILLGLTPERRVKYAGTDPIEHIRSQTHSPAGRAVAERLVATIAETHLRDALLAWLGRTPIMGSSPGDPGDADVVERFLAEYYSRVERHQREGADQLVIVLGGVDADKIRARVDGALAGVREFLLPEDPVSRRARAALVFIESYRHLPLLAWPRLLLDTCVELEEQTVLFRHRHARMVERTIGRRVGSGGSAGVEYLDQTTAYRVFPELWNVRTCLLPRDRIPPLSGSETYHFAGG